MTLLMTERYPWNSLSPGVAGGFSKVDWTTI